MGLVATATGRRLAAAGSRFSAFACALAIAACASVPAPPDVGVDTTGEPAAFDIGGRLSARRGSEGGAASFTWQHDESQDIVLLATPLGQAIAKLSGSPAGVHAEWPDGRTLDARDWDEMTARILGVPVPVQGLAAWLQGRPRRGSPDSLERDERGRTSVLHQDGWEIVYAYPDETAPRPARLTLRYAGGEPTEVRLVVDRWQ